MLMQSDLVLCAACSKHITQAYICRQSQHDLLAASTEALKFKPKHLTADSLCLMQRLSAIHQHRSCRHLAAPGNHRASVLAGVYPLVLSHADRLRMHMAVMLTDSACTS